MLFQEFRSYFQAHVSQMMKDSSTLQGAIYITDITKDQLWDTYLNSFPEEERQSFNCNLCRQFIKSYGGLVKINESDKTLISIWDFKVPNEMYQTVVDNLSKLVHSAKIRDTFVSSQPKLGTDFNYDVSVTSSTNKWYHFFYKLETGEYSKVSYDKDIPCKQSEYRDSKAVFKRALEEITPEAVSSVLDLIEQGILYRGTEYAYMVKGLQEDQQKYLKLPVEVRDNFAWLMSRNPTARVRNTAIGTLLIDLSNGTDLEIAVKKYESVVAPTNYKRSKPIISKKMVEDAEKTISQLGYSDSLARRFAVVSDISINNVIYLNRGVTKTTSIFDSLKEDIPLNPKKLGKVEEIPLQQFISNIIPQATDIQFLLERQQENNLVSLITAVNPDTPSLFKWNNNFSWSYNNGVADSIREKVKSAGGKVDGLLRVSLAWDTYNDLDLHIIQPAPRQRIYYGYKRCHTSGGQLDVDMNVSPDTRTPVENIIYPYSANMREGAYQIQVHNFTHRELTKNFTVEVEFNGEVYTFESDRFISPKEFVDVATFTYTQKEGIVLKSDTKNSAVKSVKAWNIDTNKFHKVNTIIYSPNYWEDSIGNKHVFFMLEDCKCSKANGFFNEFLKDELYRNHKRVFEVLTNKLEVVDNGEEQLSGVGFSFTNKTQFHVKVDNNRIFKVVV